MLVTAYLSCFMHLYGSSEIIVSELPHNYTVDLGELRQDSTAIKKIRLKNNTRKNFIIKEAILSCSCTSSELLNEVAWNYGDVIEVALHFDLVGKSGEFHSRYSLRLSANEQITVDFVAHICEEFPSVVQFGVIESDIRVKKVVSIISPDPKDPLRLVNMSYNDEYLTVTARSGRNGIELDILPNTELTPGTYVDHLEIFTSDESVPKKHIQVSFIIPESFFCTPSVVFFGRVEFGKAAEKKVVIATALKSEVDILNFEIVPKDSFKIVQIGDMDSGTRELVLEFKANAPRNGFKSGKLFFDGQSESGVVRYTVELYGLVTD